MKKKKKIIIVTTAAMIAIFLFLVFLSPPVNIQEGAIQLNPKIKSGEIGYYLGLFGAERHTFEAKQKAREDIQREFESYGYRVREERFDSYVNLIAERGISSNPILVGAHYDTVEGAPGGDDNTSGLAAMLSVARYNTNDNVVFAAFDGEEVGLLGSKYYAGNNDSPALVVVFETIGYKTENVDSQKVPPLFNIFFRDLYQRLKQSSFKGNFSTAVCSHNAKKDCELYESAGRSQALEVFSIEVPQSYFLKGVFWDMFRSDHTPFIKKEIPAIMITDTANFRNPNYHMPSDTPDKLDMEFIAKQANAVLRLVAN